MDRLRGGDRRVGIAHRRGHDEPALDDQRRFDAEEGRLPQHQVGQFARLDRAHLVRDAVGDGGIDGVLGDVALGAEVVVRRSRLRARAPRCAFILCAVCQVRMMTSPTRPMACESRRHHAECAEIVQDVFGGDGLAADADFGESHVLGDAGVEVMADHQHVQVLVDGVDGVGAGRVGRRRQHVRHAADSDDVGRVPAAGALGVVGVDGAALEGGDGVFDEAGFVQGVGVDGHLHVVLFGHRQAAVDGGRSGAPVFVQLQPAWRRLRPVRRSALGQAGVALAQKARCSSAGRRSACSMRAMFQGPGVQVVALVPAAGPVPPPIMVVTPDIKASSIAGGR